MAQILAYQTSQGSVHYGQKSAQQLAARHNLAPLGLDN